MRTHEIRLCVRNANHNQRDIKSLLPAVIRYGNILKMNKKNEFYGPSAIARPGYLKAQDQLNRNMRNLVDNAKLASGPQIIIGENEMTEAIVINGQTYKIGFRGKVYAKRENQDWVLSDNYTTEQIQDKIRSKLTSRKKLL